MGADEDGGGEPDESGSGSGSRAAARVARFDQRAAFSEESDDT